MGITQVSKARSTTHRIHPQDIDADHKFNGRWEEEPVPEELIRDMLDQGQIQAVVVRDNPNGDKPLLVVGFRRWLAAMTINRKRLGGHDAENPFLLECKIRDVKEDLAAFKLNLAENANRKAPSDIDDAHNMHRLHHDFGMTQAEIAEFYGISTTTVNNRLQLLTLAPAIQQAVHRNEMTPAAARELLGTDEQTQQEALRLGDTSTSAIRAAAANAPRTPSKRGRPRKDPNSKIKTLKDTRNMISRLGESDNAKVSMLAGMLTAWMDGKMTDTALARRLVKLLPEDDE